MIGIFAIGTGTKDKSRTNDIEMLKYIDAMTCCCGSYRCKNKILPLCQSVDDVEAHIQGKEDKNNSIKEDRIENCPVRFQKLEINR